MDWLKLVQMLFKLKKLDKQKNQLEKLHNLAKKASEDQSRLKDLEPIEGEVETLAQADTLANGSSRPKVTWPFTAGAAIAQKCATAP